MTSTILAKLVQEMTFLQQL